ncbi:MAG: adenylosuccinate lyase [Gammaproteobacteria bacterium]|nr:adenylosuccinate lyase [Gammaproteobacteria bacterium]MYF01904.1 adenylosuccinate lyase [Gammaproteobacteria bacterium]MYI76918.1 adenylosuccinate lyase [Gammaproteobacteria bacterium]
MTKSSFESLTAIGPLDGRYRAIGELLSPYASEWALMRYRVRVEVAWFLYLNYHTNIPSFPPLSESKVNQCQKIWKDFSIEDGHTIREIENRTNHDVKAVELFLREKFVELELGDQLEWIHFACTSEDINNLAYALMIRDLLDQVLTPRLDGLVNDLLAMAEPIVALPMLARTHGQPASPTTLGKEIVVFASRMHDVGERIKGTVVRGKVNGAVGNYNAHTLALPNLDWPELGESFVKSLGLTPNPITTQIESHDYLAHFLNDLQVFNGVLLDCVRDMWNYIAIGYFRQKQVSGEVGSSTMPHKVNPINFENAEGNLGIANSLQTHLAHKLLVSRWQRDLSDSTVLRNLGVAVGHTVLSINSTCKGISKLEPDQDKIKTDLDSSWEVLTEAVQTVMRTQEISDSYGIVKQITRGKQMDDELYLQLLSDTGLSAENRAKLVSLRPDTYLGVAKELALREIDRIRNERLD